MKHFQQIWAGIDVVPLLTAIKRRPELWREDTYLRDYPQGPFGDTETIMLRFPVKRVLEQEEELRKVQAGEHPTIDQHECIDYPPYKLLHEARPLVMNLMSYAGGERLGRVMINSLRPGGRIFPHADTEAHADYYSRFHIVLQSQPGVSFRAGDETIRMQTGEIWWFNNKEVHEVINNSADDRIHIVADIRTSR